MGNYDEVLEVTLNVPGNTTKVRIGYDGTKVLVAVLPSDSKQLPSFVHVYPNDAEE